MFAASDSPDAMIPKEMFFTKGVGRHMHKLQSFELALRDAGIEKQNLVRVSSIYPTSCKIILAREGIPKLRPGAITFVVLARRPPTSPIVWSARASAWLSPRATPTAISPNITAMA